MSRKVTSIRKPARTKERRYPRRTNAPLAIDLPQGKLEVILALDPTFATDLLSHTHEDQRKIHKRHVGQIARALKEGTYKWTGVPFIIDSKGMLIDGQHRAMAVVNSGVAISNAILVTVKEENTLKVIDTTAAPRSLQDLFHTQGGISPNHTVISALLFESGDFKPNATRGLSKPERYDAVQAYPLLEEAKLLYVAGQRGSQITAGTLAGALSCVRVNHDLAMAFFTAAFSNEQCVPNPSTGQQVYCSQAALLSQWLIRIRMESQKHGGRGRMSGEAFIHASASKAVTAWNAYRTGTLIKKLTTTTKIAKPKK